MKQRFTLLVLLALFALMPNVEAKVIHLLPRAQSVTLTDGAAPFALGRAVHLTDPTNCALLNRFFTEEAGCTLDENAEAKVTVALGEVPGAYDFELDGFPNEAYSIEISANAIKIVAVSPTGVIRAAQTLSQLAMGYEGTPELEALTMKDWPAFKLRGFMHDVGRSFVSVEQLKKQIDALAKFKVNTFHWHFTENQAWRLEIKAYPQLTSAESMTRFPGLYYTQEQCKEIQDYAYERGVTIIPEVDMPGHSQAFVRAMGHDMQTEQGVAELKVIIKEVCELFDKAEYIHIGGDEVTITYPNFLQTMIAEVKSHGKKVAVWNPIKGVNVGSLDADMTQMWSSSGAKVAGKANIDCRYNYTNHFDVFADLVGIYKSNIYYQDKGTADVPGFISCPWNDRKTATETDIFRQNNVYANTIASTERAWIGGGEQYIEVGGTTLPNSGKEYDEFADWERRFLFHKATSLASEAHLIPYVEQTNVRWRITDGFPNGGDATKQFPPETEGLKDTYTYEGADYSVGAATGAGIYLNHTWASVIPTYFGKSAPLNQTAYAWTYVYSPIEQTAGALIEFQNYGRSERDNAPDAGKWDRKGSRIWLNDTEILPPTWENTGVSVGSDWEVLLKNENLTAREPIQLTLKQGWNKVFLKLPYVAASNVRLNKWLFTFVLTDTKGENALEGLIYSPNQYSDENAEILSATISEIRQYVSNKCGEELGQYPIELADDVLTKANAAEATLSESLAADEREAQLEELNQLFDALKASLEDALPNGPQLSEGDNVFPYLLKSQRDSRYTTSTGVGSGLLGNAAISDASKWKFVLRNDNKYDIVNVSDNSYISPTATKNTQIKTASAQPASGWDLTFVGDGFVIITSGTTQFNQTTSVLGYKVYNWGDGTNTTDGGCRYQIIPTEMPVIPDTPDLTEPTSYTIDLTTGSFTKSNPGGTWHSEWSSSEVSGLTLSLNANNMEADNQDANLLSIYSGQTGTCTITLSAPDGYVVTNYSFDYKLRSDNQTASITLNAGDINHTCTAENQHISVDVADGEQATFTQSGNNKGVTYSNFTVTIAKGELAAPFETTSIVDGAFAEDTKWYVMKIKNQFYLTDNAGANKIVATGHGRTELADSDLWCFTGDAESGYQIYNKQAGPTKVLASSTTMSGTTGAGTFPTLQPADALPSGYVGVWNFTASTDFSGVNGYYIALSGYPSYIMNLRDGNLAFWTGGADAGSTIVITAAEDIEVEELPCYVFDNASSTIPYRIPAIAQASNGDLIAVADYRYSKADIGSGHLDLRYRISSDHGKTWGDTKTLISYTHNGGGNLHTGYGDPCIVADRTSNRVMVLSCSGNVMFPNGQRNKHQGIARFYSEDNGQTWSKPYDLSDSIYALFDNCEIGTARSMFVGSGKISQSKTIKVGDYYRIYCAVLFKDAAGVNKNYALYSDDFGDTWSVLGGVNVAPIPSGADEPKAEELPDGSVLVSSRVYYGRQYNVFHYTDAEKAEGSWSTDAFSGAANNGTVGGGGNPVNGEILVVPAKRNADGQLVYLLLQSLQFGNNRTNVGIYYKELLSTTDFSTGANVAKNWDGRIQVSNATSAYTTMVQMDNDTIAFFYEENSYNGGYDMVYKTFSIDSITGNAYSATDELLSIDEMRRNALAQEWADVADYLGNYVGNITEAGYASIETAYNACVADYSDATYAAFKQAIEEAETVQLSAAIKYRLRNKLYPTKYLVINADNMTIATLDEANENQLVSFVPNTDGSWQILGEAAGVYVGSTGANETRVPVGATGSNYIVVSALAGDSYLQCTTPTGTHPALHAAGDNIRIVPWNTSEDGSRWYIEPTNIVTDIEALETVAPTAPEVFYDLQGRRVENPTKGVYITSRKRKVLVK